MILERLTLSEFRAYRGRHVIELSPRVRYRAERPIILFGGLNGAGKTTLMLAIKLALYGRHALGMGTSKSAYDLFLRESVHASSALMIRSDEAFVEIDFVYGKLGDRSHYTVRRSWSTGGRRVQEELSVLQDGQPLSLSAQACQGFLNELVPIGVSELFFFDGEKIAELAEDETGRALRDAIQQLLGLHLVERLRGDLRVYMLRQSANGTQHDASDELDRIHADYEDSLRGIDTEQEELARAQEHLGTLHAEHDRLDLRLSERGGDWGVSRESWRAKAAELTDALETTERELRDELAGIYPLGLAREALVPAFEAAAASLGTRTQADANDLLASFATTLKGELGGSAGETIDRLLDAALRPVQSPETRLDVSHRALGRMEQAIRHAIPESEARVERLLRNIETTQGELDVVTLRMEQAPDEAALADDVAKLAELAKETHEAAVDVAVRKRELKTRYRLAIDKARMLRDRHTARSAQEEIAQPLEYAERSRRLLKDFRCAKAQRTIAELEYEFGTAFQELARKDDLLANARIDPLNFTVKLLNREGRELRKAQLSAGEKQIYAIAMLDALARTSGRRLPVVIDTPLGRLDSQHRSNLVTSYFPRASHQVILLSTDVEVDESFYKTLSPCVSHAFEIRYDKAEQASSLHEGYFWRSRTWAAG
ncbi:MAG: DNA sulfur modification protein DndD [Gammaproteobacteria bacterium]|nr:DNA sulfur modification protein DndD [Gammaproteobacteria bacterium]